MRKSNERNEQVIWRGVHNTVWTIVLTPIDKSPDKTGRRFIRKIGRESQKGSRGRDRERRNDP